MRDLFGHQTAGDILEDIDPDNHDLIIRGDDMKKGKILGGIHRAGESIITLHIKPEDGPAVYLHAEARLTFRSLEDAFGDIGGAIGQEIYYTETDFGTMAAFQPVGDVEPWEVDS